MVFRNSDLETDSVKGYRDFTTIEVKNKKLNVFFFHIFGIHELKKREKFELSMAARNQIIMWHIAACIHEPMYYIVLGQFYRCFAISSSSGGSSCSSTLGA